MTPIAFGKKRLVGRNSVGGFMPDGQNIIFAISPSRRISQIVLHNIESGRERILHELTRYTDHLALSPDGAQLAYFEAGKEGPPRFDVLVLMSVKDASTQTLWAAPKEWRFSSDVGLNWMPDGKHVLLATYTPEGEKQQLYLVNVESGERKAIGPVMPGENQIQYVVVHPNRTTLAFSRGQIVREIWAIENIVFEK